MTGGSALTESLAIKHDRPCLGLVLELVPRAEAESAIAGWIIKYDIETLNVAGPRASGEPRIYDAVREILQSVKLYNLFAQVHHASDQR